MKSSTLAFYETHADDLISRYDSAEMSALHDLLLRHLPKHGKVLDIGFGSGRDLAFLHDKGFDIYGIDPVEAFVTRIRERYPLIADHFSRGDFAEPGLPDSFYGSFDAVISIAVWMHLRADEQARAIDIVRSLLKPSGILILSFSVGGRDGGDGLHFEPLELDSVVNGFCEAGFTLLHSECGGDALGRDKIVWVTVVMGRDKKE